MKPLTIAAPLLTWLSLTGCDMRSSSNGVALEKTKPTFAVDKLRRQYYDGKTDDLATGGLGLTGLRQPLPAFADPLSPTPQELRRSAIYHNYNHLLTLNSADGYGHLMAPLQSVDTNSVAGFEYVMPVRYSDQSVAAVHMVQVPDTFDVHNPCIVAAPSSGSRGIYGAIGVVGAWALGQKCAVAYTDKGTGTGFDWLNVNKQQTIKGVLTEGGGERSHFAVKRDDATERFMSQFPHRVATKHAHSQHLPDKEWGTFVLQSVQLAFHVLNEHHSADKPYTRENTQVIAAGISNGGGSVLRAAELDSEGWIDAVVASEPALNLPENFSFTWRHGGKVYLTSARDLLDQATLNALFLPCAALAVDRPLMGEALLPIWKPRLENRCELLHQASLLTGDDTMTRARAALAKLHEHGMLPEAEPLALLAVTIYLWEAVAVNYANSYGRHSVGDHLCNLSYSFVDAVGDPVPTPPAVMAGLFGPGSGVVPTGGISLVNDASRDSPKVLLHSKNDQGIDDLAFENMRCLRRAWQSKRVQQGLAQTRASGDLQGKPAIIVHGRSDNLIHVNSNSRPYVVLNQQREGGKSKLRYYEVTHGQHFDNLLQIPTLRSAFVPLHFYFEQALDNMLAHLRSDQPLLPSQVVSTQPVDAATQVIAEQNLPAIAEKPRQPIMISKGELLIP